MPKSNRRFTDDTNGGKRQGTGTGDRERYSFHQMRFVRLELTEEEKQEFKSLLESEEFSWDFLNTCIEAGYGVSFGKDKRGGGHICTIRAEYKDMLDGGLNLSGRGKTAFIALAVCEYKSTYLADETGWLAAETRRGGSYDDVG